MTDQQLIEKLANPESKNLAFSMMVDAYQKKIYYHIRRMVIDHDDANDLTQDTFIKAWRFLDNFKGDSNLYTWLYKIATNVCLTHLDKKRKWFFVPITNVEKQLSHLLDDGKYITGNEIQLKLQKAILQLPEKQRLVFNMKYYDELTYEDMSEITGTSIGALKASYHHAVKKIEHILSNQLN